MGTISPSGREPFSNPHFTSQESGVNLRYDPRTQSFQLTPSTPSKARDKTEEQVEKISVPPDFSSPTFLQKISAQPHKKAEHLDVETDGVGEYFMGETTHYQDWVTSISDASDELEKF